MQNGNQNADGRASAAIWLFVSGLAALAGFGFGATALQAIAVFGGLALPALAAFLLPPARPGARLQSAAAQVLGWTLAATFLVVLTGGARSPLTILFVLGPLVGLSTGRKRLALEATGFAALAYLALLILEFWLGAVPPAAGLGAMTGFIALAAILQAGWLIAATLVNQRKGRHPAMTEPARAAGQGTAEMAKLSPAVPVLIARLGPFGRVQQTSGRTRLMEQLRPGELAELAFGKGREKQIAELLRAQAGQLLLEQADGSQISVEYRADTSGGWLAVYPLADPARSAESARREGERAVRGRTAFFASLGHELKTPLNAIIGFSDMMQAKLRGPLPEPYDEYATIINDSAQELLLMVEDILDLAKSETTRQRLDLQPVDLMASARSVVGQLQPQAARAGVRMIAEDGDVWASADARAVRQIWQNLLSNAIKYSDAGSKVTLGARQGSGMAQLHVADEGAGMDEADLAHIAEPFAQGENARGRVGTGLGLAVVKRFAELHGGQVRIETAPGKGTRVEVSLPLADASESFQPRSEAAQ